MSNFMPRLLPAVLVALALTSAAFAQDYPNRPVRLIVPFPPGGSNDVVGRLVAKQLSTELGQQVFVDNHPGAGGVIGTQAAANAAPDGYTLLVVSLAHAVNPALYKLDYDPIKSFEPVAILATGPNVLVVNPELPVHSVKELIALAIGLALRCENCMYAHIQACLRAGATREQVLEAAGVAVLMQGGPTYTYLPRVVEALDALSAPATQEQAGQ